MSVAVAVVAHRGDSERFPENTLPAFASAVALGVETVELDVRTTADGECVVIHDATLLRLWGVARAVADATLAEVRALGLADIRIPTLAEVLDLLDGTSTGVLIDVVDPDDAEVAWRVVRSRRHAAIDVRWCGETAALRRVRSLDPDAAVHLGVHTPVIDADLVEELAPTHLNLEATLLSPGLVAAAHDRGLLVSAWTVDRAGDMAAVIGLGADSVTTNRPGLLQAVRGSRSEVAGTSQTVPALREQAHPAYGPARQVAEHLASWAAGYIRATRPGPVATKAHPADLVTDIDLTVEQRVRDVIAAVLPDHLVVGEEQGGRPEPGRPTWWLDPVDGTSNLASGLPWSSFSLALAVDESLLVGTVADPWRGEVMVAARGEGLTVAGLPTRARLETSLAGGLVLTEWAAHLPWPGMSDLIAALADRHVTTRVMGSGTLALASVAAGRCLGAAIGAWSPMDHAAGLLLALEAGAVAVDAQGRSTTWPTQGPFLVAAPGVARELTGLFLDAVRGAPAPSTSVGAPPTGNR